MTEQVTERGRSAKKNPLGKKYYFFLIATVLLLIICVALAAGLGLGYQQFVAVKKQFAGSNQEIVTLQTTQRQLTANITRLEMAQQKISHTVSVNRQETVSALDTLRRQQSQHTIQPITAKIDLYPLLLMAQYLPKAQAIALLVQLKTQPTVVNQQVLAQALTVDIQALQNSGETDWSGIYQRIQLLHDLLPKLTYQEPESIEKNNVGSAYTSTSKFAEYWQKIKNKLSTLIVIERQGDGKVNQKLRRQLTELSATVINLNQAGYQEQLQKISITVQADFKKDRVQQQWLKNLTWLESQSIALPAITLQSLKVLRQAQRGEGN
ncbi:hypothetical protein AVI51_11275 [Piscirickettsia salmonis]|uniref:Uncharacterized protein n=1 Tax=Piscirickettsia salmonis TaxID=1238 RepID=A0A9Q5YL70_PISSA|nr:uroporphyrinogen-III C-methyltransferase [Piscirickettsia salmonis]ALA26406.1 Uroporphyrinogen III methylase [Piscirickettsia salmonis]APS43832.1 hypothetical protein AVI48_05225 [Piscirickettsia salmonis]APS47186.1 hypothetical protein AVI49_05825 [Piscirickettsia salmonis]APS51373.1 hypothetical protein AVI50_11390 [Piscirickettsia salmonis]APS54583.1 hypothetical protein AVI51_11275 [Piscirickettsia salmonis]